MDNNLLGIFSAILLFGQSDVQLDDIGLGFVLGSHDTDHTGTDTIEAGLTASGVGRLGKLGCL